MNVLVVDDDLVNSLLVTNHLEGAGFEVTQAGSGEEGWQAYLQGSFSIVIMDWEMPGMSGPELCRLIRSKADKGYTYLILLTGRSKREDRFDALDSGADDFLTKPFDASELQARLSVATRILRNEAALHRLNEQIEEAHRHEGELASAIQKELLLGTPPEDGEHLWIASTCIPSAMVAGDFFDFYRHAGGVTDIVTGDVMGKGVPAALVAAGVKSSLEKGLLSAIGSQPELPEIRDIMDQLCAEVVPRLSDLETFSTLTYARLFEGSGRLQYVNCGNPEILLWNAIRNRCELLPTTTVPIGFLEQDEFEPTEIQLQPGDLLLFYSDGITDFVGSSGELLGSQGFVEWVEAHAHLPLDELGDALRELHGSGTAKDDFTCVAVRFVGFEDEQEAYFWTESRALGRARQAVHELAESIPLTQDDADALVLAFQEAATNAIRHARPGHGAVPLRTRYERRGSSARVHLSYPGVAFDPSAFSPSDECSEDAIGGFGLTIIHRCVDGVEYSYREGISYLTLIKHARP